MAERVFLHVGTPKTGTSFVQERLFQNPDALAAQDYLYPAERFDEQFLAALDLMQLTWGGLEREAVGAWDRLAEQVRRHHGTAIISHEIFGFASPEHVARAMASLGDAEVHVVVSARDLVRQIPAEWQENLKHRRQLTYATFLHRIQDPARGTRIASWFWGVQEVPEVLNRWAADLPARQVHLVTVPPKGAPPELLWERFVEVFGLRVGDFHIPAERANPSLGVPETAMIRRLNEQLADVLPNHDYRRFVREFLVHQTLSKRSSSARLGVPPEVYAWAYDLSRSWVAELAQRGYRVVGSLDELIPGPAGPWSDPDQPEEAEVADVAITALAAMIREVADTHGAGRAGATRVRELEDAIARIERAPDYRLKRRLVRIGEQNRLARLGLRAYRRAFRR